MNEKGKTRVHVVQLSRFSAITSFLLVVPMLFGIVTDHSASATNTATQTSPQMVVRAGLTDDVFVLLEGKDFPHSNVIERSSNGGSSFVKMGSLPIKSAPTAGYLPINQLLFANANDGFALGYSVGTTKGTVSPLYVTVDGGTVWRTVEISSTTSIREIAVTANYLYAITSQCLGRNAKCSGARLERTAASSMSWVSLPIPAPLPKYASVMNVTAFGNDVWLSTMDQISNPYPSYVATSYNLGASFSIAVHSLLNSVTACGLAAMSTEVLWAICDQGNMAGQIPYSSDGGAHWAIKDSNEVLSSFAFGAIDPITSGVAFVVNERFPQHLYRVTSGTATPTVSGTLPKGRLVVGLCFVNQRQGLLLTNGNGSAPYSTLWYTNDGGTHWTKVFT